MAEQFVAALGAYRAAAVFNPWGEVDVAHEIGAQGPQLRRRHLQQYLQERIGTARTLLLAEAIGYQGGHFSGIPMTSERLLLGGLQHRGLSAALVFRGLTAERTSLPALKPQGFSEPTATIVWGLLAEQGIDPRSLVLWNAFPWHPYQLHKGLLSNRTPTAAELLAGHKILLQLLQLGDFGQIIALGEKAALQLQQLGISAAKVRHPANGGAGKFRRQLLALLGREHGLWA